VFPGADGTGEAGAFVSSGGAKNLGPKSPLGPIEPFTSSAGLGGGGGFDSGEGSSLGSLAGSALASAAKTGDGGGDFTNGVRFDFGEGYTPGQFTYAKDGGYGSSGAAGGDGGGGGDGEGIDSGYADEATKAKSKNIQEQLVSADDSDEWGDADAPGVLRNRGILRKKICPSPEGAKVRVCQYPSVKDRGKVGERATKESKT
jgi:hypothetical protein